MNLGHHQWRFADRQGFTTAERLIVVVVPGVVRAKRVAPWVQVYLADRWVRNSELIKWDRAGTDTDTACCAVTAGVVCESYGTRGLGPVPAATIAESWILTPGLAVPPVITMSFDISIQGVTVEGIFEVNFGDVTRSRRRELCG